MPKTTGLRAKILECRAQNKCRVNAPYETAITALNQHFDPIQNKDMAIFEFRELKQEVNETLNDFYRRLKTKASDCNFPSVDDEIRTQIIHKTRDKRLRRPALRESFTLQKLLNHGRSLECTD